MQELKSGTERCLNEMAVADPTPRPGSDLPIRFNARQVRARAYALVERHAVRLGMDSYGGEVLLRAIEAIPAEGDA